jgi:hypothetical protein
MIDSNTSTVAGKTRRGRKLEKPSPDFPLFPHQTGR